MTERRREMLNLSHNVNTRGKAANPSRGAFHGADDKSHATSARTRHNARAGAMRRRGGVGTPPDLSGGLVHIGRFGKTTASHFPTGGGRTSGKRRAE